MKSKNLQEGGPLGLVQNGDVITIDIQKKRMDVHLTDEELEERRKKWSPPPYKADKGVLYKVYLILNTEDLCLLIEACFLKSSNHYLHLLFKISVHKKRAICIKRMCD